MKNFKKILAGIGMLGIAVPATLSVVACGETDQGKTPATLNNKSFDVKINSFTSEDSDLPQNQWGQNSIGALYSTLWAINNKPVAPEYPIVNEAVGEYLTKGESITRSADDGANITLNGRLESDRTDSKEEDWHKDILKVNDKIVFNLDLLIYSRNSDGELISKPAKATITINIIAAE